MAQGWSYGGAPRAGDPVATVTLVEGVGFCISGRAGDIRPGAEQGLFFRDTRFVSRFELTIDSAQTEPLAARLPEPFAGEFVVRRPPRPGTADSTLLVVRRRYVGNGMLERITVRNLGRETAAASVVLRVDADFAGLFDVKEGRAQRRDGITTSAAGRELTFGCRSAEGERTVVVRGDAAARAEEDRLRWDVVVGPREEQVLTVEVQPGLDAMTVLPRYRPDQPVEASGPAIDLAAWRRAAPTVSSPDERLANVLNRSAEDLGVLRIADPDHPDRTVIAAGAPWFMTLFGRDALLTSWMLLPLDPSLALGTLRTLADLQGRTVDALSEEQPGRILHEIRSGLDVQASLGGVQVYFGSIDATPLFVMLLGELRRWGLPRAEVEALLPHADLALQWVERYGDHDGDGFVEYQRATDRGLLNQGWKDSFDAISDASGVLAEPPIALAEVQGYVYAAYLARAELARDAGDTAQAEHWSAQARALKRRFDEAFWLEDRGWYAMALDRDKKPVDALASNMGHCLWTGIVDEDKAAAVARHLVGPDLFSGFGIRTLAASMGGYNPMSYHNGSVWPHDNAIAAAGLARYDRMAEAQRVALAILDAAECFQHRLPELFCGFDRSDFPVPVPYPTSCSPQAWAAAAPLLLLRSLLRLDPSVPAGRVSCEPDLPVSLLPLRIDRLRLADTDVTVRIDGPDDWELSGLPPGLQLARPHLPE